MTHMHDRAKNADGAMQVTFSIKERNVDTGEWRLLGVNTLAGKPLEEMFTLFAGKEVVAELTIGEERFFFCGTDFWLERMSRKGRAVSFAAGLEILRTRRPELLQEVIPLVEEVAGIFEGATVQQINFPPGEKATP